MAFSPTNNWVASTGWDGTVRLWDASTGKELRTWQAGPGVTAVSFSADGRRLAASGRKMDIIVWNTVNGELVRNIRISNEDPTKQSDIRSLAFSPNGRLLISANTADHVVRVWDLESGQELMALNKHGGMVERVVFAPDGRTFASAGHGTVIIWEAATGKDLHVIKVIEKSQGILNIVHGLAYSPDSRLIATGSTDGVIKFFDVFSGRELHSLYGHENWVTGVAFSPDGRRLVSISTDRTLKIWDTISSQSLRTLKGHRFDVLAVAFRPPDGRVLASVCYLYEQDVEQNVKTWDTITGQELRRFVGHTSAVTRVAFSPDGRRMATSSADKTVRVWDSETAREMLRLMDHSQIVQDVVFSPDGKWLASASDDMTIKVWDATSGQVIRTLSGHADRVVSVRFRPDGQQLASGSFDKTIRLWDVTTGHEVRVLSTGNGTIGCIDFSPDGSVLAACADKIEIWDVQSGKLLKSLHGHSTRPSCVAFSPDGKHLASGSTDHTIKIWDNVTWQELRSLRSPAGWVYGAAFSPDSQMLATAVGFTVAIWDGRPGTPETRDEREALGLIRYLLDRPLLKAEVDAAIRADSTITDTVRRRALGLLSYFQDDASRFYVASHAIVNQSNLPSSQYQAALRYAQTACQLRPNVGYMVSTLGTAQYRIGKYEEALATLIQADKLNVAYYKAGSLPSDLALMAMTYYRLRQNPQAIDCLRRLREAMRESRYATREDYRQLVREAEALLESKESDQPRQPQS